MSRLSFRARLFIALMVVSAVPLLIVSAAGAILIGASPEQIWTGLVDPVGYTEKTMMTETSRLPEMTPGAALAIVRHDSAVQNLEVYFHRRKDVSSRWGPASKVILGFGTVALIVLVIVAGQLLSRQYAAPLTEMVDWTRRIQRRDPLPVASGADTMPEVITLQRSLYELERGLAQARAAELEAERLRAFGEVARRVAHEMKNPLTPIRLAVRQLARRAPPDWQVELEVIATESARLEAMAREFAELGRLPEGVSAAVDLRELLDDLLRNGVPETMTYQLDADQSGVTIDGYYDPLRRGFSNVLRNAVEACHGEGSITVTLHHTATDIVVQLSDNGPGIPVEKRELIFQPYYTEKGDGTGLGLAIVRQTIEQHHGTIAVGDTPGGGATFTIRFPT